MVVQALADLSRGLDGLGSEQGLVPLVWRARRAQLGLAATGRPGTASQRALLLLRRPRSVRVRRGGDAADGEVAVSGPTEWLSHGGGHRRGHGRGEGVRWTQPDGSAHLQKPRVERGVEAELSLQWPVQVGHGVTGTGATRRSAPARPWSSPRP